ncbi:hypothetical protein QO034_19785 [Sedimentitalea sp. JM2-8]|uniref:Gluconate 2-dehydrogenase subunit 3 family protein n=1 Tax=Sedimentitalea xiamensis TaxID=3050037 RepID=A0ABT7FJL2_9RHOB|nr:hypothetical protein [Sedimentitalea xiamensis]MDK3075325.1 hypothetical protein [Sedimentitalea xiamensis]
MHISRRLLAALAAVSIPGAGLSADFSDPTWPCVQRKVESLSLGLMWPLPVPDGALPDAIAGDADILVETLALRRVSLEKAAVLVDTFVADHPGLTADDLGRIFRAVFDGGQADRSAIISGIERYSLKQIALSEEIDGSRARMSDLMKADAPDYDKVDELEEKLDWDERIFRDRAQSLTYVCETPVLLEKRAYAIAQMLLGHVPE